MLTIEGGSQLTEDTIKLIETAGAQIGVNVTKVEIYDEESNARAKTTGPNSIAINLHNVEQMS